MISMFRFHQRYWAIRIHRSISTDLNLSQLNHQLLLYNIYQINYNFLSSHKQMNERSSQKFPSKVSVESLRSRNSNSMSLGRPSWSNRNPSLSKKVSLVYVMSVESDHKSDIYEEMLEENLGDSNRMFPWNRSSLENNRQLYNHQENYHDNNDIQVPQMFQTQRRSNQRRPLYHSCQCYMNCQGQSCPCFSARDQICIKQSCCQTCIQMKNAMLLADRGEFCTCKNTQCLKSYCKCFQNNGVCTSLCRCQDCKNKIQSKEREEAIQALKGQAPSNANGSTNQRKHCTCKKTKCNKKYCSCLAMGVKCTKFCQCENCNNCDRIENDMEQQGPPEFIQQQNLQDLQFPQRMSFQKMQFVKY